MSQESNEQEQRNKLMGAGLFTGAGAAAGAGVVAATGYTAVGALGVGFGIGAPAGPVGMVIGALVGLAFYGLVSALGGSKE